MSQEFLSQANVETLVNLLLRSQQVRSREALCIKIGINPKTINFLRDSSDADFATQLIYYLHEIGDREALCKLCCEELFPIFKIGQYASVLKNIALHLNCHQPLSSESPKYKEEPTPLPSPNFDIRNIKIFNLLIRNKLITGLIILFCSSTSYSLYKYINHPINNGNRIEQSIGNNPTSIGQPIGNNPAPIGQPMGNNPAPIEHPGNTTLGYTRLQKLLLEKNWKEADQETTNIMFSLSKRKTEIRTDDLENFSCKVLNEVDQLWRNASANHFGFSIQNEIWQQEREQKPFENAVGWDVNGQFIENNPELINFSLSAPKGHLPTVITLVDRGYTRSMENIERIFFTHITSCQL